jgi:hypothetical protein
MYNLNASILITSSIDEKWSDINIYITKHFIKFNLIESYPTISNHFKKENKKRNDIPLKSIELITISTSNINSFILDPDTTSIRINLKQLNPTSTTEGYYLIKFKESNKLDYTTFIQYLNELKRTDYKQLQIEYKTKLQDREYS